MNLACQSFGSILNHGELEQLQNARALLVCPMVSLVRRLFRITLPRIDVGFVAAVSQALLWSFVRLAPRVIRPVVQVVTRGRGLP